MHARFDRRAHGRLVLAVAAASVALSAVAPAAARGQACLAGTVADEFTADAAGLTREWILQLPSLAGAASLSQVVVGDGLVVAQVSDGTVHAIQSAPFSAAAPAAAEPRPGSLLWTQRLAGTGGPITRAGIGRDIVAVAHDLGITGLERSTGQIRWRQATGDVETGGTAVIGTWVYSPTSGGTVRRLAVNPLRQPEETTPPDEAKTPKQKGAKKSAKKGKKKRTESLEPIAINDGGAGRVELTPIPLAEGVLWCTTDGLLVTLQPTELDWRRLDFSLVNPPAGQPAVRDRSIFATTTAGDLARIDLPTGMKELQFVWHTVLPGPAFSGPFLSGETLVVSLGELGIAAYSAETGSELWHTCLTGRILAVGGGRVWLVDERGLLGAFDLADGSPRERLCLGPFTLPVVNSLSDRLVLASPSGMLVSLAPRGTPTPAATAPDESAPASSDPAATPRP